MRAIELRLRELGGGAGVGDLRDAVNLERGAAGQSEPRLDLRGVRGGLVRLRADLGIGNLHERRAGAHARAALDRGRHDATRDFRGDIGLLLCGERPADGDEP